MKILYSIDETAEVEATACLVTRLAEHADVHVVIDAADAEAERRLLARVADVPRVQAAPAPPVSPSPMSYLAERLMRSLDRPAPAWGGIQRWCERLLPTAPDADAFLRAQAPDVLLTPPLAEPGSLRADLIRSARAAGIPHVPHGQLSADDMTSIATTVDRAVAADRQPAVAPSPLVVRAARPLLARVAARVASTPDALRARDIRVARLRHSREVVAAARKAGLMVAKQQAAEERSRRHQQRVDRRDAVRRAQAERDAAHQARRDAAIVIAREQFVRVREWAARMRADSGVELSAAERRLEVSLAPLWTASVDEVATLRHWSGVITGDRVEAYADIKDADDEQRAYSYKLRREFYARQKDLGRNLMVSDPDVLGGGFGSLRNGIRYNADTIRFMHAAGALNDGAVLAAFRRPSRRRVVWVIGGGWGGFAHYFKVLHPNVTYLLTGQPELLMISATFLKAAFPAAACRFYEPGTSVWADMDDIDFVFAPERAIDEVRPPRLELTVDLGALPLMTPDRMAAHVRRAYAWGSRFSYSMLPPGTLTGPAAAVQTEFARYFWPHVIPPRPVGHAAQLRGDGVPLYTHLAGWKRIRA